MTKGTKWLIAALTLSVAFNIFVVGVAIGKKVNGPLGGSEKVRGPRGGPDFNLRNMVRLLPPEAQEQVRDMMRTERKKLRSNFEARRAANMEIIRLITAEEVDIEALSLALNNAADQTATLATPIYRVMLEIVPTLSVEERREFAEQLQERRKRFRRERRPPSSRD